MRNNYMADDDTSMEINVIWFEWHSVLHFERQFADWYSLVCHEHQ